MFRNAFSMFDLDGNGVICATELGTLLRALGQNPTDEEMAELMIVSLEQVVLICHTGMVRQHHANPISLLLWHTRSLA